MFAIEAGNPSPPFCCAKVCGRLLCESAVEQNWLTVSRILSTRLYQTNMGAWGVYKSGHSAPWFSIVGVQL